MRPALEAEIEIVWAEYEEGIGEGELYCPACLEEAKRRIMRRMRSFVYEVPKPPEEIEGEIFTWVREQALRELPEMRRRFKWIVIPQMIDAEIRVRESKRKEDLILALEDWFLSTRAYTREQAEKAALEFWKKLEKVGMARIERVRRAKVVIPKGFRYFYRCPVGHILDIRKGRTLRALVSPLKLLDELRKAIIPELVYPPPKVVKITWVKCPQCGANVIETYLHLHEKYCPAKIKLKK